MNYSGTPVPLLGAKSLGETGTVLLQNLMLGGGDSGG